MNAVELKEQGKEEEKAVEEKKERKPASRVRQWLFSYNKSIKLFLGNILITICSFKKSLIIALNLIFSNGINIHWDVK